MHFNIYLDDETGKQLNAVAKQSGQTRNALIREAIKEWLARHARPQWPEAVMAFEGVPDMPPFEAGRKQLKPPADDPLA
jgi:predicted transcriptional regulator